MTRDQLEHALRAVQTATGESEFVIIGSQAILGQFPNPPQELLVSREIDIYAPGKPEASDLIHGACGEHTDFPGTHDFYIDGVSPATAVVPGGWRNRAIPVCNTNTNGATGWCLEVHDIAVAKYFANRPKDRRYLTDLWRYDMLDAATLTERMRNAPVTKARRQAMLATMQHDRAAAEANPVPARTKVLAQIAAARDRVGAELAADPDKLAEKPLRNRTGRARADHHRSPRRTKDQNNEPGL